MSDRVFLTETRRDVLAGDADLAESTIRSHKSRIRSRARTALAELIEVAESEEIENADVFEPQQLARLVAEIVSPQGDITPRWNFDGTDAEYSEQYQHPMAVVWRLDHLIDGYADTLLRTEPPRGPPVGRDDVDLIEDADE